MKNSKHLKNLILVLNVIGILIALYLSYYKVSANPMICGIGECEKVQNSPYSELFGIPIAFLGVLYFFALFTMLYKNLHKITVLWILWGLLFYLYLTFLEIFVIHAICGWCVISYIVLIAISIFYYFERKQSKSVDIIDSNQENNPEEKQ